MSFITEFTLLLKVRYSLIYIPTFEEDRLEYTIRKCVKLGKNRAIYTWNFIDGFLNVPNNNNLGKRNPLQALDFIEKSSEDTPAIFLLKDFHKFFNDIAILRKLRNLSRLLQTQPKTIIITAPEIVNFPLELRELITILEFELPSTYEIREELIRLLKLLDQSSAFDDLDSLILAFHCLCLDLIISFVS